MTIANIPGQPDSFTPSLTRKPWTTPRIILSELAETEKFANALESPATGFGGGQVLTNQGPAS